MDSPRDVDPEGSVVFSNLQESNHAVMILSAASQVKPTEVSILHAYAQRSISPSVNFASENHTDYNKPTRLPVHMKFALAKFT